MNYARLLPALGLVQGKEQHKPEIRLHTTYNPINAHSEACGNTRML